MLPVLIIKTAGRQRLPMLAFLIVVHNRSGVHYYAVPVYSHKGNGVAKKYNKNEYVSVADGRYPDHVVQQSVHRPITALLKNGVDELLLMNAAYASYAVPRRYGLPVAHQGNLDEKKYRVLGKHVPRVDPTGTRVRNCSDCDTPWKDRLPASSVSMLTRSQKCIIYRI